MQDRRQRSDVDPCQVQLSAIICRVCVWEGFGGVRLCGSAECVCGGGGVIWMEYERKYDQISLDKNTHKNMVNPRLRLKLLFKGEKNKKCPGNLYGHRYFTQVKKQKINQECHLPCLRHLSVF